VLRLLSFDSLVKQIQGMEESAESLRERSLKFYKGCRKYTYAEASYLICLSSRTFVFYITEEI
jgi:hypothetical protein